MVIQCPECSTRFKLSEDKLKPEGIKVRCAKCRHVFPLMPPLPPEVTESPVEKPRVAPEAAGADDLWGQSFDEALAATPPRGTVQIPSAADQEDWESSFAETEKPRSDGFPGDSPPREESTESKEVKAWGEAFDATDLGLEKETGTVLLKNGFTPLAPVAASELLDEKSRNESEPPMAAFDEEPTFSVAEPADDLGDEFEFEELPSDDDIALAGEPSEDASSDLAGFSFEEEGVAAFSFAEEEPVAATSDFSFQEEDIFATESPVATESSIFNDEPHTDPFDELPEPATESKTFDFNGMSFRDGDPSEAAASPMEETIFPAIQPKPSADRPAPAAGEPQIEPLSSRKTALPESRRGPMALVLRIFLLLLLGLGATAGYLVWRSGVSGVRQLFQQVTSSPESGTAAAQIRLPLPNSFFVMNRGAGQLFVVQGEAVNGYLEARSAIAVKGMLHDDKGDVLMQQTAFCGNPMDLETLKSASFATIEETMNNPFGNALANLNIAPGKAIPYMIVFRDLPANVTEFTVEVADSKPGGHP